MHDASIDLSTLTDRARDVQIGQTTLAYHVRPGEVEIVSLRTPRRDRGKGSARAALTAFLQAADEAGLQVVLGASPLDARTHLGRLVDFYRSFGFALTGRVVNAAGEPEMVRLATSGAERSGAAFSQPQQDVTESPEFRRWFGDSKVVDADGKPLVVYHGTSADFDAFDSATNRSLLNEKYQGDGFHFSEDPDVASRYADSARNQSLNKARTLSAVDRELPPRAAAVFRDVVENGYASAWDKPDSEVRAILDEAESAGIDLNDLLDIAEWVEGSNYNMGREARDAFDAGMIFGGGVRYLPDWVRESAVKFGIDDALPNHAVMPAYLKAENILRTDDRQEANRAQKNGYDGVHYSGSGTVSGTPEWIVFRPEQIKSVNNRGTFDPNDARILYSQPRKPTQSGIGFYSALAESVDAAQGAPKRADATAWRQWLDGAQRRGEFKQSERDWIGVDAWLAGRAITTKEELAGFVRANQVRVSEVVLGGPGTPSMDLPDGWETERQPNGEWFVLDEDGEVMGEGASEADAIANSQDVDERGDALAGLAPKFATHQLPGGQNYRELLLTLPMESKGDGSRVEFANPDDVENFLVEMSTEGFEDLDYGRPSDGESVVEFDGPIPAGVMSLIEQNRGVIVRGQDTAGKAYVSSHFTQPNILAHVRFNERNDADGKRVLFVEEVQSDWHQEGRKKGYASGDRSGWRVESIDGSETDVVVRNQHGREVFRGRAAGTDSQIIRNVVPHSVPDAPLKKEWPLTAMKRMIRWAADNGFDRLSWTTGAQQAERYDLSTRIRSVMYNKRSDGLFDVYATDLDDRAVIQRGSISIDSVEELFGKEIAEEMDREKGARDDIGDYALTLSGIDLQVGGEGLRAFYDEMLPSTLAKYVKRWGGSVGSTTITTTRKGGRRVDDGAGGVISIDGVLQSHRVHSLDITPEMRAASLRGQPLFHVGANVGRALPPGASSSGVTVQSTCVSLETDRLADVVGRFLDAPISIERASVDPVASAALDRLVEIAGRPIVVYRVPDGRFSANGCVIPGDPTIYVNADSESPILAVACHEFLHQLRRDRQDLYAFVADEVRAQAKMDAWASELRKRPLSRDLDDDTILEELVADAFGDALMDPQFLHVLVEKNPSAFHAFVVAVRDFFARIVTAFGKIPDLGSRPYLDDIRSVHAAYARMVDAFVRDAAVGMADGSVDHPLPSSAVDHAPAGAWVLSGFSDLRGQGVYHVRDLEVAALELPELDRDGRLAAEKRPFLAAYTQRAIAGEVPPNIHVVERHDGTLAVVDGHRRVMAARAAGITCIRASVAPLIECPSTGKVPMTHELAIIDVVTSRTRTPSIPLAPESRITTTSASDDVDALRVVSSGERVSGYLVRAGIANTSSIEATIERPRVLPGVREVPMTMFDPDYIRRVRESKLDQRTDALRAEIVQNRELTPLIVGVDSKGAYIIEGGHRFDALIKEGVESIPALVAVDEDEVQSQAHAHRPVDAVAQSADGADADLSEPLDVDTSSPGPYFKRLPRLC